MFSDYELGEELGRGHFGVVFKGKSRKTGEPVAIKRINKRPTNIRSAEKHRRMIDREVQCLQALNESPHPNIVRMHELYEDDDYFWLVMEMCGGSDLYDAIVARGKFSEQASRQLMFTILHSVAHIHKRGIVHRDLKPENIRIEFSDDGAKSTIKIIDFGLARPDSHQQTLMQRPSLTRFKSRVGTLFYIAPEVLRRDYSVSCDEWSCGVIAYILLCGFPPFNGKTDDAILRSVKYAKLSFAYPEWKHISRKAKQLIAKLLNKDPDKRITAREALQDPWFAGMSPDANLDSMEDAQDTEDTHDTVKGEALRSTTESVIESNEEAPPTIAHASRQVLRMAWKAFTAVHP